MAIFENSIITLVLIACIYYLVKQLWPGLNKNRSQGACDSCSSACDTQKPQ